jgi:inner membrane protein
MASWNDAAQGFFGRLQSSQFLRVLLLGFLVLLLLIPKAKISDVIDERASRRDEAVGEVTSKWGGEQKLTGPILVVPYTHRWSETSPKGVVIPHEEQRRAYFLPERLDVKGRVEGEERARGIFSVPVYALELEVAGSFARPDFAALGVHDEDADWSHASLSVGISDVRAIQATPSLRWLGEERAFLPGAEAEPLANHGIHVAVPVAPRDESLDFSFPLRLHGSDGIWFSPFARETQVAIASKWPSPSFQGAWLPTKREVTDSGFSASWSIPYLGRNYAQAWREDATPTAAIEASRFGVRLVSPVDAQRMAQRSVKYAGLFLLLTFSAIWIVEVLAGLRVHPIQYLLIGGALVLFFLLELSLAEHLPFAVAYALASLSVLGAVGGYALAVLGSRRRALSIAGVVGALYGYLYTLLMAEDDALLVGSLGLFATLVAFMWLTRKIDWYAGVATRSSTGATQA